MDAYIRLPHRSAFSGINQLQHVYPALGVDTLRRNLATVDSYTRHREPKPPKHNPVYVREMRQLLQADLLDKKSLSGANRGIKYWLVVIDTFTRKIWAQGLNRKTTRAVTAAFQTILQQLGGPAVRRLLTDRGTEFTSAEFNALLADRGIVHNYPIYHAPHVERVQRTLQSIVGKYLTQYETARYEDIMQLAVASYNNKKHRMIGMTPNEAENELNHVKVRAKMEEYYTKFEKNRKRKIKFKVGDWVRARAERGKFFRSFHPTFDVSILRVAEILTNLPSVMFRLSDVDGNLLPGRYYQEELQPVRLAQFKIQTVHNRRRRTLPNGEEQVLVSWQGLPDSRNSYVPLNLLPTYHRARRQRRRRQ